MGERITVVTESNNLRATLFIPDGDQITVGNEWEDWH